MKIVEDRVEVFISCGYENIAGRLTSFWDKTQLK
jgi:hypothetical protein